MIRTIAIVSTFVAGAALAAGPAHAEEGWLTDGEGGLYALDTDTGIASGVGALSDNISSLAATPAAMLGVQDGPGDTQHLVAIDLANAVASDRGQLDPGEIWVGLTSTADGAVYVASASAAQDVPLWEVDPADGSVAAVGEAQPDVRYPALAGGCGGTLLGADEAGRLVKIDRSTGTSVVVGPMATGGDAILALAFGHQHRTLWAITSGLQGERLWQVDPATGTVTPTSYMPGQIGGGALGLAFDATSACRYERTVSLTRHERAGTFTGRVRSGWRACTDDQRVRVYRKQRGPDARLGSVTTRPDGRFTLHEALKRGSAYAVADSASGPAGVCLRARSPLVR